MLLSLPTRAQTARVLITSITIRVLARILDLGRVSNDQGVHMSIILNSQIHGSSYARQRTTDNACGCSMLCNQIQGEHTLILHTLTLEY